MPSRPIVAAIVFFWLAMAGWYVFRDLAPRWAADAAPPYHIDLTDEVSASRMGSAISWNVYLENKHVGMGATKVVRSKEDRRRFELRGEFFNLRAPIVKDVLDLRKLWNRYVVTQEGDLVEMEAGTTLSLLVDVPVLGKGEHTLLASAKMVDGQMTPRITLDGQEWNMLGDVAMARHGRILNPLYPFNRIPGLSEGKTWKEPLLHLTGDFASHLSARSVPREVFAEVVTDSLSWNDEDVACFKIEYRGGPQRSVVARTWVRRRDGLVLRQEANLEGIEIALVRDARAH